MSYVLKASKAGGSVTTDAVKDLLFHSDYSTLKIKTSRSDVLAGSSFNNLAHGLSYIPLFMSFQNNGSGSWYAVDKAGFSDVYGFVSATNVDLQNTSASNRTVRTFVFIDRLV